MAVVSLTNLIAHWRLEEAANGSRADSHTNGLTLTDVNANVGQDTGKQGNCASGFSDTAWLARASESLLQTGAVNFSIACWVYIANKSAARAIVSKRNVATQIEFYLFYDEGADRFTFRLGAVDDCVANNFGSVTVNTWYFLSATYTTATKGMTLSVNAGTRDTATALADPTAGTSDFRIGIRAASDAAAMNGRIDEVSFFKRALSTGDETTLYNAGAGLAWPWPAGGPPIGSLGLLGVGR